MEEKLTNNYDYEFEYAEESLETIEQLGIEPDESVINPKNLVE